MPDIHTHSAPEDERDVTYDFLLCNRCGTCRSVCPVYQVVREEWASARGKVELAEEFFRSGIVDERKIREIFEVCLHCKTCEEACPSGMRADEIILAVMAETARRGLIPRLKRLALKALGRMDNALFKVMRAVGLSRKSPLHGIGAKSPLGFLFPLLGWPRERSVPLPSSRPFLERGPEIYRAEDVEAAFPPPEDIASGRMAFGRPLDTDRAADIVRRLTAARRRNLEEKRAAYFFVGHTVNHFFPEEAEAVVGVMNLLGIDVLAPKDQLCCGAPHYYSGDIEGARESAVEVLERFKGHRFDWIVTSCASGGLTLKETYPRLLDITADGYFEIAWDPESEVFYRKSGVGRTEDRRAHAASIYREQVEGKVLDINELLAEQLGYHDDSVGLGDVLGNNTWEAPAGIATGNGKEEAPVSGDGSPLPVVTYHQPCHLNRGQAVSWQPEALLTELPGYRYVRMQDADRCCGGGGAFTFTNSEVSAAVAQEKMDAVEAVLPDVLATSCPVCRIQLMDMCRRRFVLEAREQGKEKREIPVMTPVELMLDDLKALAGARRDGPV